MSVVVRLHHVGLAVDDLDRTSQQLTALFGFPAAMARTVKDPDFELRTAMVPVGGASHLQLIEPIRGLGAGETRNGAVVEVAFEVTDIAAASAHVQSRGLSPVDVAGRPLPAGYAVAGSGSRYLYLPADAGLGTRVELIEPAQ